VEIILEQVYSDVEKVSGHKLLILLLLLLGYDKGV
jgi:hypothetical protein